MATALIVAHLLTHEVPMLCACVWGLCKVFRQRKHVCHDHEEK